MRTSRRHHKNSVYSSPEPRSLVRVLCGEEELHAAVEQALGYDRLEVARVTARMTHYEAMDVRGIVLETPASSLSAQPVAEGGLSG
jgi:hypothetical protein